MGYAEGWAAINLEMPAYVPRTEYSAEGHWDLVRAATGIAVAPDSPAAQRSAASAAFRIAWDYSFHWSILIHNQVLERKRTRMGHAVYAAGGVDFDSQVGCPFTTTAEVLDFDPLATYGAPDAKDWTRRFDEHYRASCAAHPGGVNMTGIYITLVSGLVEIFGWEMLLAAAGEDPERFGAMAERYAAWMQPFFEALAASCAPVVMVHDDIVWTSGAIFRPAWYRRYVFPAYRRYFAPLREAGKRIAYTSDGTFTAFIDDIAASGVHGFVMEPTTDMAAIAARCGRTHFFIGNADTRILLSGTRPQIRAEVERCMAIGKHCPGFFLAVGNHIPSNTPVENALYYDEVYRELRRR